MTATDTIDKPGDRARAPRGGAGTSPPAADAGNPEGSGQDAGRDLGQMDINRVLDFLPHRFPMVMIDRVLRFEKGKSLVALKNVTYNEPYFPGHFPVKPVMPAVMIIEAMVQASGILGLRSNSIDLDDRSVYYFVGVDNARFRQPVMPGDQLIITVELGRTTRGVWKADAIAEVDGKRVASAQLMGTLRTVDS